MSPQTILARITGFGLRKPVATMNKSNTRHGTASVPGAAGASSKNFLPGLRPVELEVDAYFHDAFAGPVF